MQLKGHSNFIDLPRMDGWVDGRKSSRKEMVKHKWKNENNKMEKEIEKILLKEKTNNEGEDGGNSTYDSLGKY